MALGRSTVKADSFRPAASATPVEADWLEDNTLYFAAALFG
jgi:hypothetical protein